MAEPRTLEPAPPELPGSPTASAPLIAPGGLSARARRGIKALLGAFFAVQLATLPLSQFGRDLWPFCPYAMFAYSIGPDVQAVAVVLHQDDGRTRTVRPRHVVPLEFFRATRLVRDVFVRRADRAAQDRLARLLIARLNEDPWRGFDERYDAARPDPGHRFTGLDVIVQHLDFGAPADLRPPRVTRVDPIYSFREPTGPAAPAGVPR